MFAIVDIETTGGSPTIDRISEIAVIIFDGKEVIEEFSTLLNPCRPIDPWVVKLTGITQEMVQSAPLFEEVYEKIFQMIQGKIFTAHNVKFDFGMLRKEFKRLGVDFTAKQLDTVSLSRRLLPGFPSYSLGKLCDSLGIKIDNRHRALGDARATVKLLELLLATDTDSKFLALELRDGLDVTKLPPQIPHQEIEVLPDESGIFYFKNQQGEVLYFEGVKSIRQKVIQKLINMSQHPQKNALLQQIYTIDYELTGSELVARLMALEKLQEQPAYSGKTTHDSLPSYGIFLIEDADGIKQLKVMPLAASTAEATLRFSTKHTAYRVMQKIIADNNIYGHYAMLKRLKEKQAETDKFKKILNDKIENAVKRYLFLAPNFFVVGEGIHPDESSVVWVENNEYKGLGFFYKEVMEPTIENLKSVIKPARSGSEALRIIRQYLKKNRNQGIIVY
jgi:DNA polymerase-3 subunit epsilon